MREPDTVQATVNLEDLQQFLWNDNTAFILAFLASNEQPNLVVPAFHNMLLDEFIHDFDIPQSANTAPRGHAKTTIAKLGVVKRFAYSRSRFCLYICNTHALAAAAVRDIANFIQSPTSVAIYGEPRFLTKEEAKGNYVFEWCGRIRILKALGVGQQLRGMNIDNQRPDLLIADDMERTDESEANKMGYKGISKWFYGTVKKALDAKKHKIYFIGNLIENRTLLADFLTSPYWRKIHLAAVTRDGTPLWPEQWSIASLRQDFIEYASAGQGMIWLAEMMNLPPAAVTEDQISLENLTIIPDIEPGNPTIEARCITVDPAISKLSSADAAVICVHVRVSGIWFLAFRHAERGLQPYALWEKIRDIGLEWRVRLVGIEAVAYQQALIHICEHEAAVLGITQFSFVPILNGREAKSIRIRTWASYLSSGQCGLTVSQLGIITQLRDYDPNKAENDDDEIDASSFIINMLANYNDQLETDTFVALTAPEMLSAASRFSPHNINRHITA